jgi:hypothetical protein
VIALGLVLAVASAVAIDGGYVLQHREAAALPPLSLRRPIASLVSLFRNGCWLFGFLTGIGGWALYVGALRVAPLSLVQACAAGGIAVLALGLGRLAATDRLGIGASFAGLALLGISLSGGHASGHGDWRVVCLWMGASVAAAAVAARMLRRGVGLAVAAGVLYAAGDVGTKAAVGGGARLLFVPALLACHGLAFVCLQLAFQRGGRLATAGVAVLWTNALPIVAGTLVFGEALPGGWAGAARFAAFALVLVGAVALSRQEGTVVAGADGPERARLDELRTHTV